MYYYRRLPPFEYVAPKSMAEAASFLATHHADTRVIAGGTMVIHRMKERIGVRKYLLSLKAIPGLDTISTGNGQLRLGAMALLQTVAETLSVQKGCGMLALACAKLGTPQIRAMGTLGGNVASHLATAETAPVLIALGGEAVLTGTKGNRMVPVENLYKELKEGELISEISVPVVKGQTWGYEKWAVREKFDYATVSAAVTIVMAGNVCQDVRIGLGGVTLPTRRALEAEGLLKGRAVTEKLLSEAASRAAEGGRTGGDIYFSAEYKKELVQVNTRRSRGYWRKPAAALTMSSRRLTISHPKRLLTM